MPPHSVRIAPGSMTTTSMPSGASSIRIESLSPSTANFVAWYQLPSGSPNFPPIDETLTIVPLRRSRMCGSTSWVSRARANTLISTWRRASASGTSSSEP